MGKPHLGHMVILNNLDEAPNFEGKRVDAAALEDAFKSVGFEVRVEKNRTKQVSYLCSRQTIGYGSFLAHFGINAKDEIESCFSRCAQ